MNDRRTPTVLRLAGRDVPPGSGLGPLLGAYHLATEAEKGVPVPGVGALPARYRAEVVSPHIAFEGDTVLLARREGDPVGCAVVTRPVDGGSELKRLWCVPAARGTGVASALVAEGLAAAARAGAGTVRLSVWRWREAAIGLYARAGFAVVEPWDDRPGLVCMERAAPA
ncbi:GNAT family N-acetyltransferase [uncultured Streptomyces sp.]|uniref:GNAT family N-acetyltransferase n=1 Tax=uncultured Streptomyces sp. TaxID=174707 RepID=UPI002621FC99|nr:GNAT family N-acetyltransferase [uncultured Streptomyces sp.]